MKCSQLHIRQCPSCGSIELHHEGYRTYAKANREDIDEHRYYQVGSSDSSNVPLACPRTGRSTDEEIASCIHKWVGLCTAAARKYGGKSLRIDTKPHNWGLYWCCRCAYTAVKYRTEGKSLPVIGPQIIQPVQKAILSSERRKAAELNLRERQLAIMAETTARDQQLSDVDGMPGIAFEMYIARLLTNRGFVAELTKASGDQGVDVIARKHGMVYAIQLKRQAAPVSRRAVSDAVAAMPLYKCSNTMVITNSVFTPGAKRLASFHSCQLVDRTTLAEWVSEFQAQTAGQP